mmetsp:Transcript_57757/g.162926  ORF Transcript_57757/g.162926 Transcript_57757/m.162926 type:complete len:442 (-) Transcript_57757:76-1401(-)
MLEERLRNGSGEMAEGDLTGPELRRNFLWMSFCFALNHGTATTPLVVATSILPKEVADVGNGILFVGTCLTALLLAAPVVGYLGPKGGLLVGCFFYAIYVGSFALAVGLSEHSSLCSEALCLPALLWYFGSMCGGLAAGILWPSQGDYFACTARLFAARTEQAPEVATAKLSSTFAFIYLLLEVACKLVFSLLQWLSLDAWAIGAVYAGLATLPIMMLPACFNFASPRDASARYPAIFDAMSLWTDPIIWLLAPTNLTFGFCAAFMNGYVNGNYAKAELGKETVAFLAALTAVIAAAFSKALGPVSQRVGKGPVMCAGAACFLCIPLCLLVLGCCGGWGWWLLVLYVLQGGGRAVYESTNKALFADFFDGPKKTPAFANCMLQSSLAFAASFFLQTKLTETVLATIVIMLAVLTIVCLGLSKYLASLRDSRLLSGTPLSEA